jgi:hypothetical protein
MATDMHTAAITRNDCGIVIRIGAALVQTGISNEVGWALSN